MSKERAFPSVAIDERYGGMLLVDWFAGQMLPQLTSLAASGTLTPQPGKTAAEIIADEAYAMADAMMAERAKRIVT